MKVFLYFFGTELRAVVSGHVYKSPFSFFCFANNVSGLKDMTVSQAKPQIERTGDVSVSVLSHWEHFGFWTVGMWSVSRVIQLGLINSLIAHT